MSFLSSSLQEHEFPYGVKVLTKINENEANSVSFELVRNLSDGSLVYDEKGNVRTLLRVGGDLRVEGSAIFTNGDIVLTASSNITGSQIDYPLYITETSVGNTASYSYRFESAAGAATIGVRPEPMYNVVKPYIIADSGSHFDTYFPMILSGSSSLYQVLEPHVDENFFSYPKLTRQPASGSRLAGALPISLDRRAIYDFGNPTLNEQYVKTKEENQYRGGIVHGYSIVGSSIFHTDTTITDDYVTLTSSAEYRPYIRLDKPKENNGVVKNVSHTIGDKTYFGRIDEDKKEIYMVFPSGTTGTQTLVYETSSDYILDNASYPSTLSDNEVSLSPSFSVRQINFNSGSQDVVYTITSITSSTDNQNIDYSARLSDPFLFDYRIYDQTNTKNDWSFFDASENIDSYSEILTKNVLDESLNNVFVFKPNFQPSFDANLSSSAELEILPQYSAKLDEEQLYNTWITGSASLQRNELTNPTSSGSYDYLKIKYANFDNFKAHYEASSSVYNIHNDPIKFSQVNLNNLDTPSFENLFYIDSGKRYTFSFENAPNPSADVMDELDARLWTYNAINGLAPEETTKPSLSPTDYPGWTRHIYVKIIKRGTGTSVKGQVNNSSGYIPLLDSIKQDKRIDGITTIKDICMGDPSFIIGGPIDFENLRDAFNDPDDDLPSVDDFWKNNQQAIKALDFVVNPSIKDLAEISFKIDYSAAFAKTKEIPGVYGQNNTPYTKGYYPQQAESRYMFIRFAVSRISDLSITDLVDLDAGAPLAKSFLITSGSVDQNNRPTMNYYPRVINNEISIDEHGDAKVTYKTFKNNYKDTSAFADYMSSNNFISGQQLIYLANPKTPVPPGDVGEIYAIKVSDFVSEFGAAAGGSVIANFKSFDVGRVGGSFVSIEPEQSIDTLTIQSDNDVIRLVGDSLTDTITLKFDGADVKNDGDVQELLQQPRMALFPADSSGNIANKVRPADSQEIQFFRKLNNIPDFITARPPDSTGLLTQFSSGSYYSSIINNTASLVIPNAGSTTFTASFEVPSGFDVLVGGSLQTSGVTGHDFSGDVTYIIQTASLGGVVPSDTEIPGYPSLQVTSPGPAEGSLLAFKFSDAVNAGFTDTYYARISQNTASILVPYNELNFANIVSSYEMSGDDTEWSAFIRQPVEVVQPTNLSTFYIPSGSILSITGSSSDADQNPDDGYNIEFTSEPAVVTIIGTPNIDGQPAIDGPFEIKLGRYENTILFDASSHTLANVSASIAANVSYYSDNRTNQIRIDGDNLIVESKVAGRDGYISSSYGIQQGSGNVLNSIEVTQDEIVTLINDEFDTSYVTSSIESGKISIRTINESRDATLRVKYNSLGIENASPVFNLDSGIRSQASQVSEVTANDYTQDLYYTFVSGSVEEEYRVRVLIAEEYTVKTTQATTDNLRHSSALMIGGVADGINQLNHIASGSALHLGGYSITNRYPDTFDPKYYGISFGDNKARIYESSSVGSVVVSERLGVDQEFTADQEKYSIHSKLGIKIENSGSIEGVEVSGKSAKITLSGSARLEDADLYVNDNAFVSGTLDVSSSVTAYNGILSKDGLVVSGSTSLTGSTLLDGPTTLKQEVIIPNTTIVRNSGSNYISGSVEHTKGELRIGTLLSVAPEDAQNDYSLVVDDFELNMPLPPYMDPSRRAGPVNGTNYEPLVLVLDASGKVKVSKQKLSDPTRAPAADEKVTIEYAASSGSIPYYYGEKELNYARQLWYVTSSTHPGYDDKVSLGVSPSDVGNEKLSIKTITDDQLVARFSSENGPGLNISSEREYGISITHITGSGISVTNTSGSGAVISNLTGSGVEISANNGIALELSSSESPIKFNSPIPTSDYFPVGKSRDVLMTSGSLLSKVPEGILVSREVDRNLTPMATETVTSSSPIVTEFMFNDSINSISTSAYSTIDGQEKEIKVIYPYGSDVTKLTASFTLETGYTAKIGQTPQTSSVTGNDFSAPIAYTFTSASTSETYTVTLAEQEHYGPSQNQNWVNLDKDSLFANKVFVGEISGSYASSSIGYDFYASSSKDELKVKLDNLPLIDTSSPTSPTTNDLVIDKFGNVVRISGSSNTKEFYHLREPIDIQSLQLSPSGYISDDSVPPDFTKNNSDSAISSIKAVKREWSWADKNVRGTAGHYDEGADVLGIFYKNTASLDFGDADGRNLNVVQHPRYSITTESGSFAPTGFRRFVFEDNISNVGHNFLRLHVSDKKEPTAGSAEYHGMSTTGKDPHEANKVGEPLSRIWAFSGSDSSVYNTVAPTASEMMAIKSFATSSIVKGGNFTEDSTHYILQGSTPFQDNYLRFREIALYDTASYPGVDGKVNFGLSTETEEIIDLDVTSVFNVSKDSLQVTGSLIPSSYNVSNNAKYWVKNPLGLFEEQIDYRDGISESNYVNTGKISVSDGSYFEILGAPLSYPSATPPSPGTSGTAGVFLFEFTAKISAEVKDKDITLIQLDHTGSSGGISMTVHSNFRRGDQYGHYIDLRIKQSIADEAASVLFGANEPENLIDYPKFDGIWHHYSFLFEENSSGNTVVSLYIDGEKKREKVAPNNLHSILGTATHGYKATIGNSLDVEYKIELERMAFRLDTQKYSTGRNEVSFARTVNQERSFIYTTGSQKYYLAYSEKSGKLEDAFVNTSPDIISKHISGDLFNRPNLVDPIASTPTLEDDSTRVATTQWVRDFLSNDGSNYVFSKIFYPSPNGNGYSLYNAQDVDDSIKFASSDYATVTANTSGEGIELKFSLTQDPGKIEAAGTIHRTDNLRDDVTTNDSVSSPSGGLNRIYFEENFFDVQRLVIYSKPAIAVRIPDNIKSAYETYTDLYDNILQVENVPNSASDPFLVYNSDYNFQVASPVTGTFLDDVGQTPGTPANHSIADVKTTRLMIQDAVTTFGTSVSVSGSGVVTDPLTGNLIVSGSQVAASKLTFEYDGGKGFDLTHDPITLEATVKLPNFPAGASIDGVLVEASSSALQFYNSVNSAVTLTGSKINPTDPTNNMITLESDLYSRKTAEKKDDYIYSSKRLNISINPESIDNGLDGYRSLVSFVTPSRYYKPALSLGSEELGDNFSSFRGLHFSVNDSGVGINSDAGLTKTMSLTLSGTDGIEMRLDSEGGDDFTVIGFLTSSVLDTISWRQGYSEDLRPDLLFGKTAFFKDHIYYKSEYMSSSLPPASPHAGTFAFFTSSAQEGAGYDDFIDNPIWSNGKEWKVVPTKIMQQYDVAVSASDLVDTSVLVWNDADSNWTTGSIAFDRIPGAKLDESSYVESGSLVWDGSEWKQKKLSLFDASGVSGSSDTIKDGQTLVWSTQHSRFQPGDAGGGGGNANFILSASVPASDQYSTGSFWYDTDDHILYARVADINDTEAWLEINTGGNASPWVLSQDRVILQNSAYKVGIATATFDSNAKFQVDRAYCDGTTWSDASSRELKEDIEELNSNDALAILDNLEPVSFRYKDKERTSFGFIAEDVPDVMTTANKDSLSPMQFVGVLTKVVKDQNEKLAEQSKKIDFLTEALEKLLQEKGE